MVLADRSSSCRLCGVSLFRSQGCVSLATWHCTRYPVLFSHGLGTAEDSGPLTTGSIIGSLRRVLERLVARGFFVWFEHPIVRRIPEVVCEAVAAPGDAQTRCRSPASCSTCRPFQAGIPRKWMPTTSGKNQKEFNEARANRGCLQMKFGHTLYSDTTSPSKRPRLSTAASSPSTSGEEPPPPCSKQDGLRLGIHPCSFSRAST